MIHVLHVWKDVQLYHGIHDQLLTLARHIDRSQFEMSICIYGRRYPEISLQFEELDVPVTYMNEESWWKPSLVSRLTALFRDLAPDIVQTYCLNTNVYGGIAARRAGVPVVISGELTRNDQAPSALKRARDMLLIPLNNSVSDRANCRVFVSEAVRRNWVGEKMRESYRIIYPAYNERKTSSGIQDAKTPGETRRGEAPLRTIGIAARLSEEKRHADLLEAMKLVLEREPGAQLLVVGDGPLGPLLKEHARKLGIAESVTFAGYRKDVFDELARMDVFALPSRSEGLPISIVEAMAAGLPVVATTVGGIPEVVHEGTTGYLVPPFRPDLLAEALLKLFSDPLQARAMGSRGRELVAGQFTWRNFVEAHERMYRELVPAAHRQRAVS
jgi:glycosyltransferase involved in cell wall biosynthesis